MSISRSKKVFISTAIDYVNASPHLGHILEKIQADVIARYYRSLGNEVFFLTGTDENSLKNVQAAKKEKISIKELVDKNSKKFYELKNVFNLSFDDFIRTTEERHIKGVQKLWKNCQKDIYKKRYKGLYCVGCEQFYKESELENGFCPEHKTKPELVEEENYFFRLSKYQDKLKKIIETDEIKIIPQTRKNEVLSFINQGLEDICISRSSQRAKGWGIDVPGDKTQKIWVWIDALSNYINAVGYGADDKRFNDWWQKNKNILHFLGKGILRFHAVYWPAILLLAGIQLPRAIFVHGYITVCGQKMSKSLKNVINPFDLAKKYGVDAVRYYLLREFSPTEDGDFTDEKFRERYNADLARGLGNLTARVITMAENNSKSQILNSAKIQKFKLQEEIDKTRENHTKALESFKFSKALKEVWVLISCCDKIIEEERPWEKSAKQFFVIYSLLCALANIVQMLKPFLPETSDKILRVLGVNIDSKIWKFKVKKEKSLFPKL